MFTLCDFASCNFYLVLFACLLIWVHKYLIPPDLPFVHSLDVTIQVARHKIYTVHQKLNLPQILQETSLSNSSSLQQVRKTKSSNSHNKPIQRSVQTTKKKLKHLLVLWIWINHLCNSLERQDISDQRTAGMNSMYFKFCQNSLISSTCTL